MLSKEELKKLRDSLPKDASATLANLFNMKVGSIRNILSGQANNVAIIEAAIELALKHKQEKDKQGKTIKSSIASL